MSKVKICCISKWNHKILYNRPVYLKKDFQKVNRRLLHILSICE